MRYLIDTHVLIWMAHGDSHKVSDAALTALRQPHSILMVSTASLWEMAIKKALNKLDVDASFFDKLGQHGYTLLPIGTPHLHALLALPHHHSDPFDRMLIAQAQCEKLSLVTHDRRLQAYDVKIILA